MNEVIKKKSNTVSILLVMILSFIFLLLSSTYGAVHVSKYFRSSSLIAFNRTAQEIMGWDQIKMLDLVPAITKSKEFISNTSNACTVDCDASAFAKVEFENQTTKLQISVTTRSAKSAQESNFIFVNALVDKWNKTHSMKLIVTDSASYPTRPCTPPILLAVWIFLIFELGLLVAIYEIVLSLSRSFKEIIFYSKYHGKHAAIN
ncbi:Uncharacterised protein [Scardovia inopinata]|uniref:Uncharacterized protein n=1 Tax=Scardovia inopinata F0304 TaxID=641146 RepID=W1MXJ1_SCAIO|nr:hypothetical protein [Scardovia inopinata]EQW18111.1 hypothetical protein HMPREF9020_01481 [Scardovia inopinata F0304]SUV51673.1 Uncharacterised protein [Scardovia inopinata]